MNTNPSDGSRLQRILQEGSEELEATLQASTDLDARLSAALSPQAPDRQEPRSRLDRVMRKGEEELRERLTQSVDVEQKLTATLRQSMMANTAGIELINQAHRGLEDVRELQDPLQQYAGAHLAALRAAAAVLAVRGRPESPSGRRQRIRSAWEILPKVAPDLTAWAVYFASAASKRARAEARITGSVSAHDVEDIVRLCTAFLDQVRQLPELRNPEASRAEAEEAEEAISMVPALADLPRWLDEAPLT